MMTSSIPQNTTLELVRKLVAFPTVSAESNLELIDFIREYLHPLGGRFRVTFHDEGRKANLFASLGPDIDGGVVLSGHTDVVPVEGQAWAADPFVVREREGRLYGRGTADMKGFIACVLSLMPELSSRNLKRPVHLAFSYDEEVGCLGVGRMIADIVHAGIRPSACIVGEPTLMQPVIAHKGKRSYRASVRGLASHSAYAPRGVNAVEAAAEAIAYLRGMARRHRDEGPYDHAFDVAHSTLQTGIVRGGTAVNIVPHECVFDFEIRNLPGDDPDALLDELRGYIVEKIEPEMHAVSPDTGFTITQMSEIPALNGSAETAVVGLVQELTCCHETGKVSYGTEASQFQLAGIPSVVCGPGSILQAHRPEEYVELEQLARCEAFLGKLLERECL
jgi:acetylornithine deacetylase